MKEKECRHDWQTDPDRFGVRHFCAKCHATHTGFFPPVASEPTKRTTELKIKDNPS